jgi:hypothetical protein
MTMKRIAIIAIAVIAALLASCAQQVQAEPAPNPALPCFDAIEGQASFKSLGNKVALIDGGKPTFAMLTNKDLPSESEKRLILEWVNDRQNCMAIQRPWLIETYPLMVGLQDRTVNAFLAAAADLYGGAITFGEFAKARVDISANHERELDGLRAQESAANEQAKNRAMQYLLRRQPTMTTCAPLLGRLVCTSR